MNKAEQVKWAEAMEALIVAARTHEKDCCGCCHSPDTLKFALETLDILLAAYRAKLNVKRLFKRAK